VNISSEGDETLNSTGYVPGYERAIYDDVVIQAALTLIDYATHPEKLQRAVEEVWERIQELGNVMIEILKKAIMSVLQPLIDAYEDYREGLTKAGLKLIMDYNRAGEINKIDLAKLNEAITKPFFYGIIGLGMAIWGAITIIQGITLGVGTIVGTLVGIAVSIVMSEIFRSSENGGGIELPVIGFSLKSVIDEVVKILDSKKVERFMISLLESILSTIGFILSLPSVSDAAGDPSGSKASLCSYTVGLVSLIFSFGAAGMVLVDCGAALMLGSLAVALSMESVALGLVGLKGMKTFSANTVLSLIGLGVSAISIYMFFTL
jgi:hypothetical protein